MYEDEINSVSNNIRKEYSYLGITHIRPIEIILSEDEYDRDVYTAFLGYGRNKKFGLFDSSCKCLTSIDKTKYKFLGFVKDESEKSHPTYLFQTEGKFEIFDALDHKYILQGYTYIKLVTINSCDYSIETGWKTEKNEEIVMLRGKDGYVIFSGERGIIFGPEKGDITLMEFGLIVNDQKIVYWDGDVQEFDFESAEYVDSITDRGETFIAYKQGEDYYCMVDEKFGGLYWLEPSLNENILECNWHDIIFNKINNKLIVSRDEPWSDEDLRWSCGVAFENDGDAMWAQLYD